MRAAVRYFSRSGNTERIADAIAEAVGVDADMTSEQLEEDVDILFLGSAVYFNGVDKNIKEFINNIDVKVGKVVNFSTTAIAKSSYKQIKTLLAAKNIPLSPDEFHCKGSFGSMHKDKPDDDDCKAAAEFAKKLMEDGN